jgi:hypothetical protein
MRLFPVETWICDQKRRKKNPTGTQDDPHGVTTASEFDSFAAQTWGNPLVLCDGVYKTGGQHAVPQRSGGRILYGSGEQRCRIELDTDSERMPVAEYPQFGKAKRPDTGVFWTQGDFDTEIEGVTISAETAVANDPKLLVTSGVRAEGGTLKMRSVTVRGTKGSWDHTGPASLQYENFGISATGVRGGTILDQCTVILHPDSYGNGITLGHNSPTSIPSVVRDCKVFGQWKNHCGITANFNTRIDRFYSDGTIHGFHQDTGPVQFVDIDGAVFVTHWAGIRMHSHNVGEFRRDFNARRILIKFAPIKPGGDCIVFAATHFGTPAVFDSISIDARVDGTPSPLYATSSDLTEVTLRYDLRLASTNQGITNLPNFKKSAKVKLKGKVSGAMYCIAGTGWCPGEVPAWRVYP